MLREYEECRVKCTLVTVNLVSRHLVINRRWRGIDRYLLTANDSTVSRVDTLCIIDGSFISSLVEQRERKKERERERKREREISGGVLSSRFALVCGPVLGLLMNRAFSLSLSLSHFRLTIRREAWRKDR